MSTNKTFACEDCERTLPRWMEAEAEVCSQCVDADDDTEWGASNGSEEEADSGNLELDNIEVTTAPAAADEDEPNQDAAESGSTQHAVQPLWDDSEDFSAYEEALEESSTDVTSTSESTDPLDKKIDSWKEQLLDLTRRSKLVDFSATKTKSLPFHRADPLVVSSTLFDQDPLYIRRSEQAEDGGSPPDAETLAADEVASIRDAGATENSLTNIRRNAKRFQRERGVDSLFIAFGTLRWFEADQSDSELRTPLFMLGVSVSVETNRDPERHDFEITHDETTLQVNPALRKLLTAERGIELPPDEVFSLDELAKGFAYISDLISGFTRWHIVPEVILGIFDFSKFGLYADLEENRTAIKSDPFIQALNGDHTAIEEPPDSPTATELDDKVHPRDSFQVLDADSSQQEAIEAAKRGTSFVLQGPPGTGKSQTISNIIAEKMAAGESVLFVSEKQAALNVVKSRLDNHDLGRFCLEAHGEKASTKQIIENLSQELDAEPLQRPADRDRIVDTVADTRAKLNIYKKKLFYQPPGQEITPYEAFGIVSKRDDCERLQVAFGEPTEYTTEEIQGIIADLETVASFEEELNADGKHPWQEAAIETWQFDTEDHVKRSLESAQQAFDQLRSVQSTVDATLGTSSTSVADLRTVAEVVDHILDAPSETFADSHFDQTFYDQPDRLEKVAALHRDIATKKEAIRSRYDASIFETAPAELHAELSQYGLIRYISPSYRKLKSRILSHAVDDYAPGINKLRSDMQLLMDIEALQKELDDFDDMTQACAHLYEGPDTDWEHIFDVRDWVAETAEVDLLDFDAIATILETSEGTELEALHTEVTDTLTTTEEIIDELASFVDVSAVEIDGTTVEAASVDALSEWIAHKEANLDKLQEWIQYQTKRDELLAGPAGDFLATYIDANLPAAKLVDTFKLNFYSTWLNEIYSETGFDTFSATEYNELLETFRDLDQQQREYAKAEIQHRVTNRRPQSKLHHAESAAQVTLRREAQKSKQHKPLRNLFDEAADLLTTLKPCFMMSPLSVAQYLKRNSIEFDTVIFDEASQIMLHDAISSIIRGDQVIIAGDSKQLPPTSFFQADIDAADNVQQDLESILDEAATFLPEKRLLWHYRSRTNELIEFSNAKYYNGALRTFPDNNVGPEMGVDFVYVEDGLYDRGGSSTNEPEARKVVELVKEHISTSPTKSIGVVAFSSKQAEAIRETLEKARESDPELDAFVAEDDALEEFFVKPLENVQGDERDSLIFSIGYGPDESGKISMNFGPLNKPGGERRLNVAVTRAKEHIQVVSSLQPGDIDLGRTGARGVEDFKHYLEYAKHGSEALTRSDSESEFLHFDSEFEEAVYTALANHGLDVTTQVQSSGYSIDLAIKHPEQPGKYVLGIECDGAAYHASKTARDRDRTRQTVLEDLGWSIHRIWSPDWASNQQREIEAITEKVQRLVDEPTAADGGITTQAPEPVEVDAVPENRRGGIAQYTEEWEQPSIQQDRSRSLDEVPNGQIRSTLSQTVSEYGPEQRERIFRTVISKWQLSRLGKKINMTLNGYVGNLCRRSLIASHNGFLWPGKRPASVPVRVNSEAASRSIEEIPLAELARAGHLILEAGNHMSREDLVLEVARLFGWERRGLKIKSRINEAVELLIAIGAATVDEDGDRIEYVEVDIDTRLLDRIYG